MVAGPRVPGDLPVADVLAGPADDWTRLLLDLAPAAGGPSDRLEPVPAGIGRLPGEGPVAFSPAPQSAPAGACYPHERVLRADGARLGLLSSKTC